MKQEVRALKSQVEEVRLKKKFKDKVRELKKQFQIMRRELQNLKRQ